MHSAIKYYFSIVLLLLFLRSFAQDAKLSDAQNTIKFTENKNQWPGNILFRAQLDGGALFLEKNAFTYSFYDKETLRENHSESKSKPSIKPIKKHAFKMSFLNAKDNVIASSQDPSSDYCNYFIGKDKSKWAGNVKNYKEVNYKGLYTGIDLQVLGYQNSIKYNFIVAREGNPNDIKLSYSGLEKISLEKGGLKLTTSLNEITEQNPYAYQWINGKRIEVQCKFVLERSTVSFSFPNGYNKGFELIIDPVLIFAASSGSTADNFGHCATYDATGNLYSGGIAFDQGYPTTFGAFDTVFDGPPFDIVDVVITKYDASGTFLQYSTYLGGATSSQVVTSLIVDAQNNLLLYGVTGSSDFPTTSNAYDRSFNGGTSYYPHPTNGNYFPTGTDIFVTKFNAAGSSLLASTYIGGSMNDGVNPNNIPTVYMGYDIDSVTGDTNFIYAPTLDSLQYNYGDYYRGAIDLDLFGNVYVATSSRSADFPILNGFDNSLGGQQDGVIFKFNSDLSQLVWSTFLGGSDNDCANGLVLDDSANVYVTGGTRSNDFPVTAGVLTPAYGGGKADGYVTKIKNDGTAMLASTYIGTGEYDQAFFVQLDRNNDVYVVGQTEGVMPISPGVYNNPNSGQFIHKMNNSLTTMLFSTVFGNGNGMPNISPTAFLVDYCSNIYVSGWATAFNSSRPVATGMPLTANALDGTTLGYDFYLIVLSTNASSLLYGTYLGGDQSREHVHGGTSRFDKKGIVYQTLCTGCGNGQDFPVTPGAWPNTPGFPNHSGNCSIGTFKMDFQVPLALADFTLSNSSGCAPLTITFDNKSAPGGSFLWDFGGNDTTSTIQNPTKTFPNPGTYLVQLLVNKPGSCNLWDTAFQYVTVYPSITADFNITNAPCSNQFTFTDASAVGPVSWDWSFDDGGTSTLQNPTHNYTAAGAYDIQLIATTINGCKDTTTIPINFTGAPTNISPDDTICAESAGAQLNASGGFAYSWAPSGSLNNANISNPIAHPLVTTTYTVNISTINSLGDTCIQTQVTTVNVFDPSLYSISISATKDTILAGSSTVLHIIADSNLTIHLNPLGISASSPYWNIEVAPTQTTTYYASILDSTGCPRIVSITIYVIENTCKTDDVFVPNTFTPNGDGENDILFVRSNIVVELYFAVYNRWGQMVFETDNISKGWDGIYQGMKADPAVFAWYLRAKCFNGDVLKKKGNTTLLR
jgi:gliding motility-associated-like protein